MRNAALTDALAEGFRHFLRKRQLVGEWLCPYKDTRSHSALLLIHNLWLWAASGVKPFYPVAIYLYPSERKAQGHRNYIDAGVGHGGYISGFSVTHTYSVHHKLALAGEWGVPADLHVYHLICVF